MSSATAVCSNISVIVKFISIDLNSYMYDIN